MEGNLKAKWRTVKLKAIYKKMTRKHDIEGKFLWLVLVLAQSDRASMGPGWH